MTRKNNYTQVHVYNNCTYICMYHVLYHYSHVSASVLCLCVIILSCHFAFDKKLCYERKFGPHNQISNYYLSDTYSNGFWQYCPNIVTNTSRTILALVRSVAVHSMNTFFVFKLILLWSPEIGIHKYHEIVNPHNLKERGKLQITNFLI